MPAFPTISVILPVRDEAARISECLESIVNQDFPVDQVEILAIDGMSGDGTREIVHALQKKYANLRLVENPRKSVTAALNIGIREARGRYFVRCDAHAAYAPDYFSSCLAVAAATGAGNVGGHARALPGGSSLMAHAIALAHVSPFGLGGGRFRNERYEGYVETVWPGCYRKELFGKVGGYNELLSRSEDIELNARLRRAGYACYLSKSIKAWYYCRPDLVSLFRQRFGDGIGVIRTLPFNLSAVKARHMIPLLFVASLMIGGSLWTFPVVRAVFLVELAVYAAALLVFSALMFFEERKPVLSGNPDDGMRRRAPRAAFLLPQVFVMLHMAYGLGSLFGLTTLPLFIRKLAK